MLVMSGLRWHLFENPVYIYVGLGIVETALGAAWYSRRSRRAALALLPAPVLALAVALTAAWVQTDQEKIAAAMKATAAGLEQRDLSAAEVYVDRECLSPGRGERLIDKRELIQIARRAIDQYSVRGIHVYGVETEVAGANATTHLQTRITFGGGFGGRGFRMGWRLQWARRAAGWRIVRVEVTDPEFVRGFNF